MPLTKVVLRVQDVADMQLGDGKGVLSENVGGKMGVQLFKRILNFLGFISLFLLFVDFARHHGVRAHLPVGLTCFNHIFELSDDRVPECLIIRIAHEELDAVAELS